MTDSRSREKSLRELEFNDLNIHLYLTLNYGTASEHLDFDSMVLYNAFVGLNNNTIVYTQYRIWIGLVSPIPDPQKMTGSEPIPILIIGLMHPYIKQS